MAMPWFGTRQFLKSNPFLIHMLGTKMCKLADLCVVMSSPCVLRKIKLKTKVKGACVYC